MLTSFITLFFEFTKIFILILMEDTNRLLHIKINYIEELLSKLENHETPSIIDIIKKELINLRKMTEECKIKSDEKKVVGREDKEGRTRYFLKDGSVYVVKERKYRYLYDAKSKVVTYEFENGQVERTFDNGVKEIRRKDGSIVIKTGEKNYDFL